MQDATHNGSSLSDGRLANRSGLPVTASSAGAVALYREAEDRIHASTAGAADLLDRALELDPAFALARIARYVVALDDGDAAAAQSALEMAVAERARVTDWERGHIDATVALATDGDDAERVARNHLAKTPKDLLVLSQLASRMFFFGGPGKRLAVLELYEAVESHYADDWAFASRLGFAASEAGQHERGQALLERALEQRPDSLYSVHGLAHVLHDTGRLDESATLLREWLANQRVGGRLLGHVHWHLVLAEWSRGDRAEAGERYRSLCAPAVTTCGPTLALADAAGFVFRRFLHGEASSELPDDGIRELVAQLRPSIHTPFVALHTTTALAAIGALDELRECARAVRSGAPTDGPGVIARAVVTAVECFAEGRFAEAIAAVDSLTPQQREGIGGSNVERELLDGLRDAAARRLAGSVAPSTKPTHGGVLHMFTSYKIATVVLGFALMFLLGLSPEQLEPVSAEPRYQSGMAEAIVDSSPAKAGSLRPLQTCKDVLPEPEPVAVSAVETASASCDIGTEGWAAN